MEKDLKNKVVVVTGAAKGIGYEIADIFLKYEAKTLILLDVDEIVGAESAKTLNNKYGEGKAIFMKCDVAKDLDAVSTNIFQNYKVDVLVNNAGILNEFNLRKTIEINCVAVMEWGMKFWEYLRKDKGGHGGTIFNVASIYGYVFDPWLVYYKASKHAVLGFTKSLGHNYNYEKSGVRVIAICPGYTDTAILKSNVWECHKEDFEKFLQTQVIQKVETVGKAAVEIFKVANSGTVWVSKDNQPIKLLPML